MALMNCPECGKEISDKAASCPNCGCPMRNIPRELSDDEKPEMFDCFECGKPLPVGIDKCVYCGKVYDMNKMIEEENATVTGRTGKKGIKCPKCRSRKFHVKNDIPVTKKIGELLVFGTVLASTKVQYRENMIYICKECGYSWKAK